MDLIDELRNYVEDIKSERDEHLERVNTAKTAYEKALMTGWAMCYKQVQWALENIIERKEKKQCV